MKSSRDKKLSNVPKKWSNRVYVLIFMVIINVLAAVTLMVDHSLYPGVPNQDNGAIPPEGWSIGRDVAFFVLMISAILFLCYLFIKFKGFGLYFHIHDSKLSILYRLLGVCIRVSLSFVTITTSRNNSQQFLLCCDSRYCSGCSNVWCCSMSNRSLDLLRRTSIDRIFENLRNKYGQRQ